MLFEHASQQTFFLVKILFIIQYDINCLPCEFTDFSDMQLFFSFFIAALFFSFASFLLLQDKRKEDDAQSSSVPPARMTEKLILLTPHCDLRSCMELIK